MKNILFIAPPAGGMGTQSDMLVERYGYEHISVGDLLRDIDKSSPLYEKVTKIMVAGKLVDDDIVFKVLEDKLITLKDKPFILDGIPRNVEQANQLMGSLDRLGLTLDVVIYLDVDYETLLKRFSGRVNCPECKATYNVYTKKTKVDGICDKCGTELIKRLDDNEETFKRRYETYIQSTVPLIEYYQSLGLLVRLDGASDNISELVASVVE